MGLLAKNPAKESKINGKLVAVIAVYLLVIIAFFALLLPQLRASAELQKLIATEKKEISYLQNYVAQRPIIATGYQEKQVDISRYEQVIPSANDLPLVLMTIEELAGIKGIKLSELDYVPLRRSGDENWFTLRISASGAYGNIYDFLSSLMSDLPSIKWTFLTITSELADKVSLEMSGNLSVIPTTWQVARRWQRPMLRSLRPGAIDKFGMPVNYLQDYFGGGVKLLGIVSGKDMSSRALVNYHGESQWIEVGDSLGVAKIVQITDRTVVIDLNGIRAEIVKGG